VVYYILGKKPEAEKDFSQAVTLAPWLRWEIEANVKEIEGWRK
jgi:hypothetical protein